MITIENVGPREALPVLAMLEWHKCKDELPPMIPECGEGHPEEQEYLVQTNGGKLTMMRWANCWNGQIYWVGEHYQVDIARKRDDIVAWAAVELPFPELIEWRW